MTLTLILALQAEQSPGLIGEYFNIGQELDGFLPRWAIESQSRSESTRR